MNLRKIFPSLGLLALLPWGSLVGSVQARTVSKRWTRLHKIATLAWKKGNTTRSVRALTKSYQVAHQEKSLPSMLRSLQLLKRAFDRLGETQKAESVARRAAKVRIAFKRRQARASEATAKPAHADEERVTPEAVAAPSVESALDVGFLKELLESPVLAEKQEATDGLFEAAEQGNAEAIRWVGAMLVEGRFVKRDTQEGLEWLNKAVAAGDLEATVYLASQYEAGIALDRNTSLAKELYKKAAQADHAQAAYRYSQMIRESLEASEEEKWLRVAAEGGFVAAQLDLGLRLYQSRVEDPALQQAAWEAARTWFEKAVQGGSANARFNLALCYLYGKGVAEDKSRAFSLLREAASLGVESAQKALLVLEGQELSA